MTLLTECGCGMTVCLPLNTDPMIGWRYSGRCPNCRMWLCGGDYVGTEYDDPEADEPRGWE